MPIRSYLLLYRNRILYAALGSLAAAILILFWTSAESPADYGVLWHHFCGCAPNATDAVALINVSTFTCSCIGILFGVGMGTGLGGVNGPGAPIFHGETRYLLTRPATRAMTLLTPVVLATVAIVVLPLLGLLVLVGWLRLVHAPALGHMLDVLKLIPGVAAAGTTPSLKDLILSRHLLSHYIGSVSIGLCAYALFYAQRWTTLSNHLWVRLASSLPLLLLFLPSLQIFSPFVRAFIFLMPAHGPALDYVPPASFIALHFAFAMACLYGCWTIAREVEL